MSKVIGDLEKSYKNYSKVFALIITILLVFLIIPTGTKLPPLDIGFKASKDEVGATIQKPTGSEIVAFVILLIFITLWIYMYQKHKGKIKNRRSKL